MDDFVRHAADRPNPHSTSSIGGHCYQINLVFSHVADDLLGRITELQDEICRPVMYTSYPARMREGSCSKWDLIPVLGEVSISRNSDYYQLPLRFQSLIAILRWGNMAINFLRLVPIMITVIAAIPQTATPFKYSRLCQISSLGFRTPFSAPPPMPRPPRY